MIDLIGEVLAHDVVLLVAEARSEAWSFDRFDTAVDLLSVPEVFSGDMNHEIWTMTRRRDKSVLTFSQLLCENVLIF